MSVSAGVRALEEGRAFVHLPGWRSSKASGADAVGWLNDLVTNRVDDLGPNELRRTLFLDRTGRIRADFHVGATFDDASNPAGFVMFQDPVQPFRIEELLAPYVLSSDVEIQPMSLELTLVSGDIDTVQFMAWPGPGDRVGHILLETDQNSDEQLGALRSSGTHVEATPEDAEVHRIRRGVPRFGVDFSEDWLPAEVGFEGLVDTTKGCFLGQESFAKVRNLGHPSRLVLAFETPDRVYPMAQITVEGELVGRITSVAPLDDETGTSCIGWVRWDARDTALEVDGSFSLSPRRAGGASDLLRSP